MTIQQGGDALPNSAAGQLAKPQQIIDIDWLFDGDQEILTEQRRFFPAVREG
jgi:hypothetical protein